MYNNNVTILFFLFLNLSRRYKIISFVKKYPLEGMGIEEVL